MTEKSKNHLVLIKRAYFLSVATVSWNILEGIIAVSAGLLAGSVALLGFGIDSFIETASGAVVGWRFREELRGKSGEKVEKIEKRALKITSVLLLLLAIYILFDALRRLLGFGGHPEHSLIGIIITCVSLIFMPILALAKIRTAGSIESRSLRKDAYETITCSWLSLTTLGGLLLNATLGWWWADPAAALLLIPFIVREGLEDLR
jgi:divalent metal cation (Fe/Co/Zn/Cd) transporter